MLYVQCSRWRPVSTGSAHSAGRRWRNSTAGLARPGQSIPVHMPCAHTGHIGSKPCDGSGITIERSWRCSMPVPSCICKLSIACIHNNLCTIQHACTQTTSPMELLGNNLTNKLNQAQFSLIFKKIFIHCLSRSLDHFKHTPSNSNDISQSPAPSSPLTFLSGKLSFLHHLCRLS